MVHYLGNPRDEAKLSSIFVRVSHVRILPTTTALADQRKQTVIVTKKNRKQLLDFLLARWSTRATFAAIEKVYISATEFAETNDMKVPLKTLNIGVLPIRQIEVIKQLVLCILPEAGFINYDYESQAPLNPNDFMEMYIEDHKQCISKVKSLMEKLKIV